VRHLFLALMSLLPLLSGVIQWVETLIAWRRGVFRSSALEQMAASLFLTSLSVLMFLMWPWSVVGNRARYAMYLGLALLVAHGIVASLLASRAGRHLPARGGWIASAFLGLISLPCLLGVGHILLAPFPEDRVLIAFPLEGDWAVGQGGPSVLTNDHVRYADTRYALDLIKVGPDGKCFKAEGRRLQDHLSWGQPVRAPLPGTVMAAVETYPDNEVGRVSRGDTRGNHVLIRSAADEIILLAHLGRGSVVVDVGDSVQEGQLIAEVGNSGNTSAPHLHIDATRPAQDGPVSVPMVFKDIGAGPRSQRRGVILGRSRQ
jgi:Peptidase family M23